MIKNVLSKIKVHMQKPNVDIWNNSGIFIIAIRRPGKGDPVRMVWSTYYSASVFIGGTQYSINKCLQWFLNENDIKVFIYF